MMHPSKFLANSQPPMATHKSFFHAENLASRSILSPELFWTFTVLLAQDGLDIAWRKAVYNNKEQANTTPKDDQAQKTYYKSKLTGSPAFKELKNLIIIILSSSNDRRVKPQ